VFTPFLPRGIASAQLAANECQSLPGRCRHERPGALARWQELITDNLAAGSIPGFRKQDISFSAVQAGLAINGQPAPVLPAAHASINFQPGELRATGNPMDFALEGPGFFEVQLPNGNRAYTRDGEFHMSAQGQLVTKQGYTVMGEAGPLQFDPNNGSEITVSASGDVTQGGEIRGRIRVVEFSNPATLTNAGDGYLLADKPNVQPGPASASFLRQGFVEAANTSPTAEMASLITAMRMFEANQRVLQMQDERMGRVISELGNPS
jgi:flagellar basal-body rod protein FlgG